MKRFSVNEVLTMGIAQEHATQEFYAQAALRTRDRKTCVVLTELAAMERGHEQRLTAMRKQLNETEKNSAFVHEVEAQVSLYALARGRFLDYAVDPNVRLTGKERCTEILELGIRLEENSIMLYKALRDMVPPEMGQEQIEKLIAEEQDHRAILKDRLIGLRARETAKRNKRLSRIWGG